MRMVISYWDQACVLALEKHANAYEAWAERRTPGYLAAMLQAMRPANVPN